MRTDGMKTPDDSIETSAVAPNEASDETVAAREVHLTRRDFITRGTSAGVALSFAGMLGPTADALAARRKTSYRRAGRAQPTSLVGLEPEVAPGFDMEGSNASNPSTQELSENFNEYLAYFPSNLQGGVFVPDFRHLQGRLAQSWEKSGLDWTFHLRRGVRSPAGNEFTADDVVWSWARGKSLTGSVPDMWFVSWQGSIRSFTKALLDKKAPASLKELHGEVAKVDKYTVRFIQSQPNELWPIILGNNGAPILDSTLAKQHATSSDPWVHTYFDTQGVAGFGAYGLETWNKGSSVVLKANPNYYRGQPQFTTVTINKVPQSATRLSSLLSGAADFVTALTPQQVDTLAKSGKGTVYAWKGPGFLALAANYKTEPWSAGGDAKRQRLLRQALAFAMPYQEIIQQGFFGRATQWQGLISSVFVDARRFPGMYRTDVSRAKALLADAGYPNGQGLEGPGMSLSYVAERQDTLEPIVTAIQTGLAKANIKIELNPIPNATFTQGTIGKKDLPLFMLDTDIAVTPDAGYMSGLFYVSNEAGGLNNNTNYANPTFDSLFSKQQRLTGAARRAVLYQAQGILMSDLPFIPIVERPTTVALRKGLTGWGPLIDQGMTYRTFKSA